MQEEIKALHGNDSWDLAELPKRKNIIPSKWVHKIKTMGS